MSHARDTHPAADDIEARHDDARTVRLRACVVRIVTAYVSRAHVPMGEVSGLIQVVADAIGSCMTARNIVHGEQSRIPAVPVSRSVTDDWIICLEDGERFRSLRRHLSGKYGLTPQQYRKRWGLPDDYPMVAPSYARQRSDLAKRAGLGRRLARNSSSRKSSEPNAQA